MFSFIEMMGTHESRKVSRYEDGELCIDTCAVTDGDHNFETGIAHPRYNNGKWVQIMTSDILPESLADCGNAQISKLLTRVGGQREFKRGNPGKARQRPINHAPMRRE